MEQSKWVLPGQIVHCCRAEKVSLQNQRKKHIIKETKEGKMPTTITPLSQLPLSDDVSGHGIWLSSELVQRTKQVVHTDIVK